MGQRNAAADVLIRASECDEVGLGNSRIRKGKRISRSQAEQILSLFESYLTLRAGDVATSRRSSSILMESPKIESATWHATF